MAKDAFLAPSEPWTAALVAGGRHAVDLRADRARRDDLVAAMRQGPGVLLYAGQGRAQGWSGYQAVRWRHLDPAAADRRSGGRRRPAAPAPRAVGLVTAFACDTLTRSRSRVPFGSQLVAAGLVRAYLGAPYAIRTDEAAELADVVVDLLAVTRPPTVCHLVGAVDRAVRDRPGARRAWTAFRLLGDPTTPLDTAR